MTLTPRQLQIARLGVALMLVMYRHKETVSVPVLLDWTVTAGLDDEETLKVDTAELEGMLAVLALGQAQPERQPEAPSG